jgi:tRNA-2-methylthio-N6-dimethylallyladenosine synthase
MKKQEKNIAFKPNHELARSRTEKVETVYFHFENEKEIKEIGKNKKYFVRTYGCQANLRDSETLVGILKDIGYTPAEDIADADLVVLNTCAVRENAEKKVFGEIGLLKDQFKNKPNFILGICGCMVQQESVVQKIMQKFRHVNFVIGTHNLYDLPYVIDETIKTKQQVVRVYSKVGEIIEDLPTERSSKIKA